MLNFAVFLKAVDLADIEYCGFGYVCIMQRTKYLSLSSRVYSVQWVTICLIHTVNAR